MKGKHNKNGARESFTQKTIHRTPITMKLLRFYSKSHPHPIPYIKHNIVIVLLIQ